MLARELQCEARAPSTQDTLGAEHCQPRRAGSVSSGQESLQLRQDIEEVRRRVAPRHNVAADTRAADPQRVAD